MVLNSLVHITDLTLIELRLFVCSKSYKKYIIELLKNKFFICFCCIEMDN